MVEEAPDISAAELISDAVYQRWPEVVPMNVVIIMDALSASNQRSLYVLNNTDCPPWVLQGMLNLVQADVRSAWENEGWAVNEVLFDEDSDDD